MKNRIIAMMCVLGMTVGLAAGCGSEDASSSDESNSNSEQVELSFLFWSDGQQKEMIEAACRAYEEKTGIIINEEVLPSDESFDTYIQTRTESDTLPDLSYINEGDVMKYNEMGILADVDDLFESGEIPEKLPSVTVKDSEGKTVAVGLSNQLMLLYYNKDMFDQEGIEYPSTNVSEAWTWDEFVDIAKRLTKDVNGNNATEDDFDPNQIQTYGVGFNCLREFHQFWPMYSNGGGVVSADGKEFLWDKAESAEGLQNIVDLTFKDYVSSPSSYTFVSSIGSVDAAIGGNGYAMYINGSWDLGNLEAIEGTNVGVAVLPKMKEAVTMNCGAPLVVYNTSKHMEEAKDFYAYLINPENTIELSKCGAWLPNQEDWYTDDELFASWTADLPSDAVETIKSYVSTPGAVIQWPAYYVPPYNKMNVEYTKYIDKALSGEESVQQVFDECMPTIKELFETGTVE